MNTEAGNPILVVEDDDLMQGMIRDSLLRENFEVTIAEDGLEGWEKFQKAPYALAVLDLKIPKIDGLTLLKRIKESSPETIVIMMTAFGTIETAVQSMKLGAYDYITKPFLSEELVLTIQKGLEFRMLKQENLLLRRKLDERYSLGSIIGKSKAMQEVFRLVETIAPTNSTVLIQGESGTGKEMVAEAIHHLSDRKNKPLVKVSCMALAESVLESELFGHEKGAFTDAVAQRMGRFEMAQGGSIFLDDIDDMSKTVQLKLLRVIQEKEFERVGGTQTLKVDVRFIVASKADLKEAVARGAFREDLYYRLNVIPIVLPPLRERKDDILLLIKHFLDEFNNETRKKVRISEQALQQLLQYDWPGNIRELENLMERLVAVAVRDEILAPDLPAYLRAEKKWQPHSLQKIVQEAEKEHIVKVLESTGWQKKEAAHILDINPKTLWQKIKEYNIE
ncbi:MAG: sigma-54-dependent transcriptional regulator [Endomicrobiales bacterium]